MRPLAFRTRSEHRKTSVWGGPAPGPWKGNTNGGRCEGDTASQPRCMCVLNLPFFGDHDGITTLVPSMSVHHPSSLLRMARLNPDGDIFVRRLFLSFTKAGISTQMYRTYVRTCWRLLTRLLLSMIRVMYSSQSGNAAARTLGTDTMASLC